MQNKMTAEEMYKYMIELTKVGIEDIQNPLLSGFKQEDRDKLWIPDSPANPIFTNPPPGVSPFKSPFNYPNIPIPQSEFEVNMVEALVGWRAWGVDVEGNIESINNWHIKWPADEPIVSVCNNLSVPDPKHISPLEHCSCGIYAVDSYPDVPVWSGSDHNIIMGMVYGWGRYVRGSNGWRAQYAYPKCFLLNPGQEDLIEVLKKYHVPISIMQPMKIYNPVEDGYADRGDETSWDFGAASESSSSEESDFGIDEDYDEDYGED